MFATMGVVSLSANVLTGLVHSQARRYGGRCALSFRDDVSGTWRDTGWNDFSWRVRQVSSALVALGVEVQERVAVFSLNRPECLFVDFGAYGVRAVTIPFYATSSESQVKYMVSDASVRFVFVGGQYQYDIAFRVLTQGSALERIIVFDRGVVLNAEDSVSMFFDDFLELGSGLPHHEEVVRRASEAVGDDLANILYTSGTTGIAKGVMMTHRMYDAALRANEGVLRLGEEDVALCFLPFTHVFERAWSYLCLKLGVRLAINHRPEDILRSMREVHPTCMCAVPRLWEKVYDGVIERVEGMTEVQRSLFRDAMRVGYAHNVMYRMRGLIPPVGLRVKYSFYERTVLSLIKRRLGLERANFFPTAGAAIPLRIEEFVHSLGIMMVAGYGLTESTATVSLDVWNRPISMGSVGRVIEGLEVSFGENNEILLRGDTITRGYFRKAECTERSIDGDGWFHTGDAGYMKDGELYLTDRIKDMFKTSNGKYIAPQMLETKLCVDRYIDQIVVIAEQRKFVSALIVPKYDLLAELSREYGVDCRTRRELCENERVVKFMMYRIDTLQQEFAHYEQVKRITLLPEPFSVERGELTNTLKVKRSVISENYKDLIDKMYLG